MKKLMISLLIITSSCSGVSSNKNVDTLKKANNDSVVRQAQPKHFSFFSNIKSEISFTSLCDDPKGEAMDSTEFNQHEKMLPFNQDQKIEGDSIEVAFNFIDKCNEHFDGASFIKDDTLLLQFEMVPYDSQKTNCYCMYKMSYHFGLNQRHWTGVKVVRG